MRYFANPVRGTAPHMASGELGFIDTPRQGNRRPVGAIWCADNGCFSERFSEPHWWAWLVRNAGDAGTCSFAVAPDVVGDAAATAARSGPWLAPMRELGYPVAYVLQNGQEDVPVPWDDIDAVFIGGDNAFKLGPVAAQLAREGKARGKHVHMGRVNSAKRFRYAQSIGCDSVDGTYLVFGPDRNLPRVLSWMRDDQLAFA